MKHNCYVKQNPSFRTPYGEYEKLSSEQVTIDGRIVSRSVYVVDNPSTRYQGISREDYYLENLLAVGADLRECTMSPNDLIATSNVLQTLGKIKSAVASQSESSKSE